MSDAQGDLELLERDVAQELLASALPARVAYIARDGTPRVVPSWFHWTGRELVMPTFIAAPHIERPAARLRDLRVNPDVAISIDTESQPPQVLLLRGRVEVTDVDGVVPEYAASARQYMGEEAAAEYLAAIDQPGTRMARVAVRPTWVGLIDFETRLPTNMKGF
jgi:hypothetical protein